MSAVAPVPENSPPAVTQASAMPAQWQQRFNGMDRGQRLRWGAVAALVVAGLAAAFFYSRQPDYRVLFSNLSDKDGGAIVAQLTGMNVPYKYTEGGGAIMIPADRVHDVRLKLATQGLPKGSVSGFEIMEGSKFGITQFQERVNYQRALEGELTRSIQGLSAVQNARVHLAMPNQNGFFREQQKPTASVLLTLYPGRVLDRTQIAGIVHLVSSSVPEMLPSAVSVLDDSGKLLSQSPDGKDTAVDLQQLMFQQQLEKQYTQRILDILEPVVGKGNVKAQVTAELDFSQTESTTEQHNPNQGQAPSAVRSQQTVESTGEQKPQPPTGVPGATSNQPPQPNQAPINNNAAPVLQAANGPQKADFMAIPGSKRESVTNYEVDKTVRVTRNSTGGIKRLTAAVVVNYLPVTAAAGEEAAAPKALPAEQQAQMLALVRETIGFNSERGDSVNLMNTPFLTEKVQHVDLPLWRQPETIELAKTLAWPVGLGIAAAVVLLGLLLRRRKQKKQEAQAVDLVAADELERPALAAPLEPGQPTAEQVRLEQARALAKQNPIAVANIVKTWINGEAS
ncbi:MAG: flagellar M-ring protein FliF [Acidovorax sp.]|nr:flagellar M-ring protein FliF [Acidovorax sp.]